MSGERQTWVVFEMERVEVTRFTVERTYIPGEISDAAVVVAKNEEAAIERYGAGREGFFSAVPLPTAKVYELVGVVRKTGCRLEDSAL